MPECRGAIYGARMASRRTWLVEQIKIGAVRAAAAAELRQADEDFCAGVDVAELCRRVVWMAMTEQQATGADFPDLALDVPTSYLARLFELRAAFERDTACERAPRGGATS